MALKTLGKCVVQYGEKAIHHDLTEIWTYIRTEVLRSTNADVIKTCLEVIPKVVQATATTNHDQLNLMNLDGLLKPSLQELRSPECKFASTYAVMLNAAAQTNAKVCNLICGALVPQLNMMVSEVKQTQKKAGILSMCMHMLDAISKNPECQKYGRFIDCLTIF